MFLLQKLAEREGVRADAEYIARVSPAVNIYRELASTFRAGLKTPYQGGTHTTPSTLSLVDLVADKARQNSLLRNLGQREAVKISADVVSRGFSRIEKSLANFHKRRKAARAGEIVELEEEDDELGNSQLDIDLETADNS